MHSDNNGSVNEEEFTPPSTGYNYKKKRDPSMAEPRLPTVIVNPHYSWYLNFY